MNKSLPAFRIISLGQIPRNGGQEHVEVSHHLLPSSFPETCTNYNPTSCLREELLILQLQQHLGLGEGLSSIQSLAGSPDNGPLVLPPSPLPTLPSILAPGLTVSKAFVQSSLAFLALQPAGFVELKSDRCTCLVESPPFQPWGSSQGKLKGGYVSVAEVSACFGEQPWPLAVIYTSRRGKQRPPQPQRTFWPACRLLLFPYRF